MTVFDITAARADELAACLALLPEIRDLQVEVLAAREHGQIVGAAALNWESWSRPAGFPLAVHVIPDARRRGVGRALVEAAMVMIDGETDGLWTIGNLDEAGDAAAFAGACGFKVEKRVLHFHMETSIFHNHLSRIVERLRRNNRIPADARAVALRETEMQDVARLVATELGSSPRRLHARFRAAAAGDDPHGIDLDHSTVIMEGEHVAGALLCRWNQGYPIIEANVVAPPWRNTYVNALLLQITTARSFVDGAATFRFDCDEKVRNSMNLALRGAGEPLSTEARFYRAVDA